MVCSSAPKLLSAAFLLFINFFSSAQEKRAKFIGFEIGGDVIMADGLEYDFIRGEMAAYSSGVSKNLRASMYKKYVGARVEVRSQNTRFGLSTGLRFTRINSALGKGNSWRSSTDFFYLMNKQSELTTEYLKVKEINQVSDYIGVPVDLKFYIFQKRIVTLYVKLGFEIDYRIKTSTSPEFVDPAMNEYSEAVVTKFRSPDDLIVIVNGAAGIKLGKSSWPGIRIEIGPSGFANKNTSGLLGTGGGFGGQLNVQVPF